MMLDVADRLVRRGGPVDAIADLEVADVAAHAVTQNEAAEGDRPDDAEADEQTHVDRSLARAGGTDWAPGPGDVTS
jgi:hypothetical protein